MKAVWAVMPLALPVRLVIFSLVCRCWQVYAQLEPMRFLFLEAANSAAPAADADYQVSATSFFAGVFAFAA